jgi:CheY-like chemotaxis protein
VRAHPAPLVLVCDDNGHDREMYATYFLARGFRVQTAGDGEAAFRYAIESRPEATPSAPRWSGRWLRAATPTS